MDEINKQEIIDKWNVSGVLDHLGHSNSDTLASLLESQARDLYLETCNAPSGLEDALIPDPLRAGGLMPIAINVASQAVGLDLVSVKPLTEPNVHYDNYKKKPRLPRKQKKYVIKTLGRETYAKWVNRHEWDKPYRRCNTVPVKREGGLMYMDFKCDYEDF